MQITKEIMALETLLQRDLTKYDNLDDIFTVVLAVESQDFNLAHKTNQTIKNISSERSTNPDLDIKLRERFLNLQKKTLLFDAKYDFDSYMLYIEWDRLLEKQFYYPRRKQLLPLVRDLQDLADDKIKFLAYSTPPRIGKSTLGIFFVSWLMGKYPDLANVMSGHSDKLTKGFYKEVYSIIGSGEYLWNDVFVGSRITNTSAEDEAIDIDGSNKVMRRYPTLTCRSILGTLTGAVEVGNLLYCDDLIEDLEEALSHDRLDSKYSAYLNQLKDRKKDNTKEIHIGTRWAVDDVIGRIKRQYEGNPLYRFRTIPALNENGESNFDYMFGLGFSIAYYMDMKESLDPAEWESKYMGEPYIREGLLFPRDDLKYYNGMLPEKEPDMILTACDVAWGGGDSLSMPFGYVYGEDMYLHDVIFNKGDKTVTRPVVVGKIALHKPHKIKFEANNGGDEYCDMVDVELRKMGIKLNLTYAKAPSNMSKMARIVQVAPEIKNIYFRDFKHSDSEYRAFMRELTTFIQNGKNPHDDAPDSLAMLINQLTGGVKVNVMKRPF